MSTGEARDLGGAQEELNSAVPPSITKFDYEGTPVFTLVSPSPCVRSTTHPCIIHLGTGQQLVKENRAECAVNQYPKSAKFKSRIQTD
jgi:hypothetical protein